MTFERDVIDRLGRIEERLNSLPCPEQAARLRAVENGAMSNTAVKADAARREVRWRAWLGIGLVGAGGLGAWIRAFWGG